MTDETPDERWERLSQDRVDRPLPRRFYETVEVGIDLSILLDGRAVKTPLKKPLILANLGLAQAVADEWRAQIKVINPALMPLTKLANTALDRAGPEREFMAGEVERFAANDLVFYRAESPDRLMKLHDAQWTPVLAWTEAALQARFMTTHGIHHVAQEPATIAAISAYVDRLDDFTLTAVHNLTELTGSALIAFMLVADAISGDAAWSAAHVDEDFQISQWGEDFEAARRRQNRRADFDATIRFLKLLQL